MAAAAYRSGCLLKDERSGHMHRYEKRRGVRSAFILAPQSAPEKFHDRAVLWNAAEASETRKNSRVAREVILALPHELTDTERQALARDMALYLVERYRVAVDVAVHAPCEGDGHDPRNHHAHLLFTTRELTNDGFGAKTRILDDKESGPQEVELLREVWETLANDALANAGFPDIKIDRRTLEGQGVDRIPQSHVGKAAKNAAAEEPALKNKLKGQFQQTSQKTEDDDTDEDKGKGGKSEGGPSPSLKSKAREDSKGRTIDYKKIDQNRSRLDFNEEIKKLNAKRAAFSPIPLKDQIKQVEKLTGLLESRQKHLKTLLTKSSLPNVIRSKIETTLSEFKKTLFARDRHKSAFKFSTQEKQAKAERQKSRYGRIYRTSIHERMREMEENLNQLQQKQTDYKKFKGFIDKIEDEIRKSPKAAFEQTKPLSIAFKKEASPPITENKQTKPEYRQPMPVRFKGIEEALKVRPPIKTPDKYEAIKQTKNNWFIPASEKTKPLQNLIDRSLRKTKAAQPPKTQSEPIKRTTIQVANEKIRAEAETKRQSIPLQYRAKGYEPEPRRKESRKIYFKDLERHITKQQADQKGESLRSKFKVQAAPPSPETPKPKIYTNEEFVKKGKEYAEKLREKIPTEYHAKPYPEPEPTLEEPIPSVKPAKAKTDFTATATNELPEEPKPAQKMSEKFNTKSGFNATTKPETDLKSNEKPEVKI